MSLAPVQRVIRLELVLEDPFAGRHIGPRRTRDQVPRVLGQQSLILLVHSASPLGVCERAPNRG
jgi:hypothetical protein